ncbi:MAG: hypothetical protein ACLR0N_09420 [Bilophila wadsworthia]
MIWENLAEVRFSPLPSRGGNGSGNILVDECCKDARRIGIDRVFALTYQVRFSSGTAWRGEQGSAAPARLDRLCELPPFPDCDEVAVMRHLDAGGASKARRALRA